MNTTVNSSNQLPGLGLVFNKAAESVGQSPAASDRLTERGFRNKPRNDSERLQSIQWQGDSVYFMPFFGPKPRFPGWVRGAMGVLVNGKCNEQISGS